eukprot:2840490-Rhodomonas_salina.2
MALVGSEQADALCADLRASLRRHVAPLILRLALFLFRSAQRTGWLRLALRCVATLADVCLLSFSFSPTRSRLPQALSLISRPCFPPSFSHSPRPHALPPSICYRLPLTSSPLSLCLQGLSCRVDDSAAAIGKRYVLFRQSNTLRSCRCM